VPTVALTAVGVFLIVLGGALALSGLAPFIGPQRDHMRRLDRKAAAKIRRDNSERESRNDSSL
jgi:hypothetical protein